MRLRRAICLIAGFEANAGSVRFARTKFATTRFGGTGSGEAVRRKLKGDDADAIQAKTNTLAQASMKLGEAMYKQQQEGQPGDGGPGAGGPGAAASGEPGKKEDVVDAEFTEVDDDKKKSA